MKAFTSREHLLLCKGVTKRASGKEETEHPREEQDTKEEDPLGPREFITLEARNTWFLSLERWGHGSGTDAMVSDDSSTRSLNRVKQIRGESELKCVS